MPSHSLLLCACAALSVCHTAAGLALSIPICFRFKVGRRVCGGRDVVAADEWWQQCWVTFGYAHVSNGRWLGARWAARHAHSSASVLCRPQGCFTNTQQQRQQQVAGGLQLPQLPCMLGVQLIAFADCQSCRCFVVTDDAAGGVPLAFADGASLLCCSHPQPHG